MVTSEIDAQRKIGLARKFEIFDLSTLFLVGYGNYPAEARPETIERAVIEALRQAPKDAP